MKMNIYKLVVLVALASINTQASEELTGRKHQVVAEVSEQEESSTWRDTAITIIANTGLLCGVAYLIIPVIIPRYRAHKAYLGVTGNIIRHRLATAGFSLMIGAGVLFNLKTPQK